MHFIAVHGGAGFHPSETEKQVTKALRRSCEVTSLDAVTLVEDAIKCLEADECLNAGYGSNLTIDGHVECDAAIMNDLGDFGAVGALGGVKHPIRVSRKILETSRKKLPLGRVPPMLLVSSGAYSFVQEHLTEGSAEVFVDPKELISDRAEREWSLWRRVMGFAETAAGAEAETEGVSPAANPPMQDTVGAVAFVEGNGPGKQLAAGVSSGGILMKLSGRVGEAAVFGAGCWASSSLAISVSGTGEQIMRTGLARSLAEAIEKCSVDKEAPDVHGTIEKVMNDFIDSCRRRGDREANAGAIILVKEDDDENTFGVRLYCAYTTASMAIGYTSSGGGKPKAMILRQPRNVLEGSDSRVCLNAFSLSTGGSSDRPE